MRSRNQKIERRKPLEGRLQYKSTGTIGVLIEAKESGFIHSLRNELDRLIEAGMWISEIFYHQVLQELGE